MTAILSAAQMRAAEQVLFDRGIDPYALMERAAGAAADIIWRAGGHRDLLVLCGPGNNGGDGYVIARLLRNRGVPVRVAAMAPPAAASARLARAAWDGPVEELADAVPAMQVVDSLFGIGLARSLAPSVVEHLARLMEAASRTYAIDLPSGVETDSGALLSPTPQVDVCITFGAWKPAHWLQPAAALMGQRVLADIGIDGGASSVRLLARPVFHRPAPDAHKYSRGLVAVVGGSMPGAAALGAKAAAYGGAGYVRLLTHVDVAGLPHAIVSLSGHPLAEALADERVAAVLVGPGLGRDEAARARLGEALAAGRPTVVDADGLILLAADGQSIPAGSVLTPHEGEFRHLFGDVAGSKIDRARHAAAKAGAVLVYKGPDTVVAAPDGRVSVAPPGTSWLSTAGTGDVLAGVIAARLALTGDAFRAACEGVWLHGEAARQAGPAFIADDLICHLPGALTS